METHVPALRHCDRPVSYTLLGGGLLASALALAALIEQFAGVKWLTSMGRSSWPIPAAAALVFALTGAAVAAAALERSGILFVSAAWMLLLAPILARAAGFQVEARLPYPMALAGLITAVAAATVMTLPDRVRIRASATGALGVILLGAGLTGASAHIFRAPSPTGESILPPLPSVVIALILGGCCLLWAWSRQEHRGGWLSHVLPTLAALAVLVGSIAQWHALKRSERGQVQRLEELAAVATRGVLLTNFRAATASLRALGRRWITYPRSDGTAEAAAYLRGHPEVRSLRWLDRTLCVQWSVPADAAHPCAEGTVQRNLRRDQALSTPPFDFPDGTRGFSVYVPVLRNGALEGFVTADLKLPEAMSAFLANADSNYGIRVSTGGRELYNRFGDTADSPAMGVVEAAQASWDVSVWRRPDWAVGDRMAVPEVVLAGGWTMAALLWVALRLALAARQRAETLRQSELRYALAARATNDAIWDWDVASGTVTWHGDLRTLFGYGQHPVASFERWQERVHPEDHARTLTSLGAALDNGHDTWNAEYRYRRADGGYASVIDRGCLVRDGDGRPFRMIGAMTDVTPRRDLEAQLRQSQKMEAVGQLAGGVAHDFNNLLTVIIGYGAVIRERLAPHDPSMHDVLEIESAANRAAAQTAQLLAFGRRQTLQTQVLDLNAVIQDMNSLLRRLAGDHIEMVTAPGADLAPVRADPGQIGQVVMNLVINARDAMPEGGTLRIETANARNGVIVTVRDNGCGMDEATQARLFEPFFTTKGMGKGTGLGLSTVYGIVKQSGGEIAVQSEVGQGSTFEVWLPGLT